MTDVWAYEIAPGLQAGVALERLRFWLTELEANGIVLDAPYRIILRIRRRM